MCKIYQNISKYCFPMLSKEQIQCGPASCVVKASHAPRHPMDDQDGWIRCSKSYRVDPHCSCSNQVVFANHLDFNSQFSHDQTCIASSCKQLQAHQTGGATAQNQDFGGFPNASWSSMVKPDSPSPRPTIPVFPGCLHLLPVVLREDGRVRTKNRNAHLRGLKVETLKSARAYCSTSAKLAEISAVEAQSNTMTVSKENKATFKTF